MNPSLRSIIVSALVALAFPVHADQSVNQIQYPCHQVQSDYEQVQVIKGRAAHICSNLEVVDLERIDDRPDQLSYEIYHRDRVFGRESWVIIAPVNDSIVPIRMILRDGSSRVVQIRLVDRASVSDQEWIRMSI
jgi:hypothetical protein